MGLSSQMKFICYFQHSKHFRIQENIVYIVTFRNDDINCHRSNFTILQTGLESLLTRRAIFVCRNFHNYKKLYFLNFYTQNVKILNLRITSMMKHENIFSMFLKHLGVWRIFWCLCWSSHSLNERWASLQPTYLSVSDPWPMSSRCKIISYFIFSSGKRKLSSFRNLYFI